MPRVAAAHLSNPLRALLVESCQNGWWPYAPGSDPSLEATVWCALALKDQPAVVRLVHDFLLQAQNKDGGWSTTPGAGSSDWNTACALIALDELTKGRQEAVGSQAAKIRQALAAGSNYLIDHRANPHSLLAGLFLILVKGPASRDYPRGWAWTPDTFNWVEPTSYAMLALARTARLMPPERLKQANAAIRLAADYLLKHICAGGGWNYGNNVMLGTHLSAYATTTAAALAALAPFKSKLDLSQSLSLMRATARQMNTPMALSLSTLALDLHGKAHIKELSMLEALVSPGQAVHNNFLLAGLAKCALEVKTLGNPLGV